MVCDSCLLGRRVRSHLELLVSEHQQRYECFPWSLSPVGTEALGLCGMSSVCEAPYFRKVNKRGPENGVRGGYSKPLQLWTVEKQSLKLCSCPTPRQLLLTANPLPVNGPAPYCICCWTGLLPRQHLQLRSPPGAMMLCFGSDLPSTHSDQILP